MSKSAACSSFEQQVLDVLADVARFGQRGGVADGERNVEAPGQRPGEQRLAATGGADEQDVRLVDVDFRLFFGGHQSLVMAVHRDSQHALGRFLADDVLVELGDNLSRTGDLGEQLLARAAAFALLVENRLAQLDTLAADVDVARSFDQRTDVAIALATERTKRVLLGRPAASSSGHVSPSWHGNLLCDFPVGRVGASPSRSVTRIRVPGCRSKGVLGTVLRH